MDTISIGEIQKKIYMTMCKLGFQEHNRYFVHEDTELFIEFPSGPLGVGDAPVDDYLLQQS